MPLRSILSHILFSFSIVCFAQLPSEFKIDTINKQVREFQLDSINLSSPLDYYLSRAQVRLSGKGKEWQNISSSMLDFSTNRDEEVDDYFRNYILNEKIDCIITYRDSVATIVTHTDGEDMYLLNNCWLEDGQWVNTGQRLADNLSEAYDLLSQQLPEALYNLPRIAIINDVPKDVTPFFAYISNIEQSPEEFLLEMLDTHKLVINGEYHRRKVSWDMLKRLITLPDFHEKVGCIFMELPSWHQTTMDNFFDSDTLNTDMIIKIFQDEQLNGWWDRGEFEFLCNLWHLNKTLPADKKVKVILADYQIPYSSISSREDARTAEDRNTHMADIIVNTIHNSADKRNSLFLVGCAHVYKSNQAGIASAAYSKSEQLTAEAQIVKALGENNVFTVFQHVLPGDNHGGNKSQIRGGIFDSAFKLNGNRPIGFKLADSPFGAEPFDGIYEIKYHTATGTYDENFDGYLFLSPIENEPKAIPLTEIFTDEFVAEMQRRASVMGYENLRQIWFGRRASELTKEYIIETLLQE